MLLKLGGPLVCLCLLTAAAGAADAQLHVAVDGDDANPGTADRPLASLERARQLIGPLRAAGDGRIEVLLHPGTYRLNQPLKIGPDVTSPRAIAPEGNEITFRALGPGEVILSGGREISGWQPQGKLWVVDVPEAKETDWLPRQLYVNGQFRPRARTPNSDFYRGMNSTDGKTIDFPAGQLPDWSRREDAELISLVEWTSARVRLPAASDADRLVFERPALTFFDQPFGDHIRRNVRKFPYYFENAPEMLDEPGEWYLDRKTGRLSYWPLEGEDPARTVGVLPATATLLEIQGERDRRASNVHFRGVTFAYTNWPLPAAGFLPLQAGFLDPTATLPAAVQLTYAEHCTFRECRFEHLGGSAIWLGEGCAHDRIMGSQIADVGGNGVMVGTTVDSPAQNAAVARHNTVDDNSIDHCGRDYLGCVGVWVGIAEGTDVAHNEIFELPYSGVSVGWRWDASPTSAKTNSVDANHIHHVMRRLADGGGIYTLGFQPGSSLKNNLIHDVYHESGVAACNGLFLDEGTSGWRVEDNIIFKAADGPIRHNQNRPADQTWGKNFLDVLPEAEGYPQALADAAGPTAGNRARFKRRP